MSMCQANSEKDKKLKKNFKLSELSSCACVCDNLTSFCSRQILLYLI